MKKIFLVAALLSPFTFHLSPCHAQAVVSDGFDRLQVAYKTAVPELQSSDNGWNHVLLTLPGYTSGGEEGSPALPVRTDVIEVPFCDNIVVKVENAVYDTLQFSQYHVFAPLQPSRSKSDTSRRDLVVNEKVYATNAFFGQPLATVEVMGVARDRRLALLHYSPVQVNPVTGQVVVCRSADVTVTYVGSDADRTVSHYQRYHSPAFSVGTTLNNLYSTQAAKQSSNQAIKQSSNQAIRMVIAVPNALRCEAIEQFANWKRRQGMMVDLLYYQDMDISSNTALAEYLTSLYTNATDEAPAPSFLLLVGDHNQLRAFDSKLPNAGYYSSEPGNDHITDLYFVTWTTGDNLPDCYQGRFSATDTATLAKIVSKTLLYEQYAFTDDSYLARAALIAGEDNAGHSASGWSVDYAWVYADPTMDYIAYNYVNADNGYDQVYYYKNDTSYAPSGVTVTGYCSASSSASALRSLYNTGLGWINYSAHGDWDCWHKPSLTVTHVNSMSNNGKPSFMIGNCCLTNKFEKSVCFGEALLRRAGNAGAVAYIGGTNSTYWEQDLDWSVGVRTGINHTMAPTYKSNKLGIYDRLFHTHSESYSEQAVTAGAIVYYGNLSVNSSSSSDGMKKYYWEIYELMGDPSLMPWLGRAADLTLSASHSGEQLHITTLPHTYVALVDTATLNVLGAAVADANGAASITIPSEANLRACLISATLQNHKPYIHLVSEMVGIGEVDMPTVEIYPNPASDQVIVSIPSLQMGQSGLTVTLLDMQGRMVSETVIRGQETTLDVSTLLPGLYLLHIQTPEGVSVSKLIKQ